MVVLSSSTTEIIGSIVRDSPVSMVWLGKQNNKMVGFWSKWGHGKNK